MDLIEPSNCFQNYIWDTQTLNVLAEDAEMISLCRYSTSKGHRHFITTVQERELAGIPDRTMQYLDPNAWRESEKRSFAVMEELGFCRLSCVSLLYQNYWILDGSMRILESSGTRVDMFHEIYNNNNHHKRDATIAEAAVYHGCTLITNDKRLRNKVNKYFPDSAITYGEYKETLTGLLSAEGNNHAD